MRLQFLYLIDWAVIAVSIFNTVAMLWLGLTVLLNAERRTLGTLAAGGGLLMGGLFFVGHSAVVGRVIGTFSAEMEFWWLLGWLAFLSGPYFWYLVIAWYTGVLHQRRHRVWLLVLSLLGAIALALPLVTNPFPSYGDVLLRTPNAVLVIGGVPVAALVYPVYSVLCIVLALFALRRPVASERFMGDLARRRARPWLIAASLVLLLIGLAVGVVVAWFLDQARLGQLPAISVDSLILLIGFDLFISGLIALVVVLIGKAIVSYEVFTGKTLPRQELAHQWRRSLILAAGYGTFLGWTLSSYGEAIPPIYQLMLATVLMTVFFALLSWRSYAERERAMQRLRPFVAGQQLYERLLHPASPPAVDVAAPFFALCSDVLNTNVGYLIAVGPLAPLVGSGLVYPPGATPPVPPNDLAALFQSPQTMCTPLDAKRYNGAAWGVPLWSERGLIGVLLLGEKQGAGLYTQEEMEIARVVGERLIDTQASAEMARRLMTLQRQRLAESQVLDRSTRRVLHDEVLPRLHAAMLTLSGHPQSHEVIAQLTDVHHQIANLLHAMPATAASAVSRLGLVGALRQTVNNELGSSFDAVAWQVAPDAEQTAQAIAPLNAEVIFYAARETIRNAARYGRNGDASRPLHLTITAARHDQSGSAGLPVLEFVIQDDGVGLPATPSAETQSGHGLALHSTMMAVIGGTLTVESQPDAYTRVILALPVK
jgi:signal transduction histidine kinase